MPIEPEFKSVELEDSLYSMPQGMNAGIAPTLLPKSQLAYLVNGTVRGDFPTHRPILRKLALGFPNDDTANLFATGKFQGAALFNPITNVDCLVVSIDGNLFQLTPTFVGASVTAVNAGDPNPKNPQQVWMFQSERWLIINDGQSTPIFYDGVTARRSNSGGYKVNVTNVDDPTTPGNTVPATSPVMLVGSTATAALHVGTNCTGPGGGLLAGGPSGGGGPTGGAPPPPPPTPPPPANSPASPGPTQPWWQNANPTPPAHWPWV